MLNRENGFSLERSELGKPAGDIILNLDDPADGLTATPHSLRFSSLTDGTAATYAEDGSLRSVEAPEARAVVTKTGDHGYSMICEITVPLPAGSQPATEKYYVWGPDLSQSLQGAGGIGGLLATADKQTGSVYYYFYDANGNVGQLVNAADGSIAARYEYDPYGNETVAEGSEAASNV